MTFLFLKSSTHEIIFGFAACLSVLLIVFHKSQLGLVTTHLSTFYCRLAASLAFRAAGAGQDREEGGLQCCGWSVAAAWYKSVVMTSWLEHHCRTFSRSAPTAITRRTACTTSGHNLPTMASLRPLTQSAPACQCSPLCQRCLCITPLIVCKGLPTPLNLNFFSKVL